jgi:threonyl-tRNA synthetase
MGVVGEREAADGTVAVRKRGAGKKQEVMGRDDFVAMIVAEIDSRMNSSE